MPDVFVRRRFFLPMIRREDTECFFFVKVTET